MSHLWLNELTKIADGHYRNKWGEWKKGWADLRFDLRDVVAARGFDLSVGVAQRSRADHPVVDALIRATTMAVTGVTEGQNLARSSFSIRGFGNLHPREELVLIGQPRYEDSGLSRLSISMRSVKGWSALPEDDPAKWQSLVGAWGHDDGQLAKEYFGDPSPVIWIDIKAPENLLRPIWRQVQMGIGCHRIALTVRMEVLVFHPETVMGPEPRDTYAFENDCYGRAILTSVSLESTPQCPKDPVKEEPDTDQD